MSTPAPRPASRLLLAVVTIAIAGAVSLARPGSAAADAYVRVIAQRAPVHTGPGTNYREVFVAERGAILPVLERGTRGFWFKVELDDGTSGWVFGELVFPFQVVGGIKRGIFSRMYRGVRKALLGPSPVPFAGVPLSFSAGVLAGEGMFLLRPGWLLDKYWAVEAFVGSNPRAQKDLFLAGVGWTLRLLPGAAIGPYINAGFGAAHQRPKADNFTEDEMTLFAANFGGGFEITFKKQITLRLDFRNWTIFDPNQADNGQEYTGGLAIFF
jgi:uncharacterized protein YraI